MIIPSNDAKNGFENNLFNFTAFKALVYSLCLSNGLFIFILVLVLVIS